MGSFEPGEMPAQGDVRREAIRERDEDVSGGHRPASRT